MALKMWLCMHICGQIVMMLNWNSWIIFMLKATKICNWINFSLPAPYIKQCRSSDPEIVDCLKGALHHLRPWLKSGIPEIQVRVPQIQFQFYYFIDIEHPSVNFRRRPPTWKIDHKNTLFAASLVNDFNFLNIHIAKISFSWTFFFISGDFIIFQFMVPSQLMNKFGVSLLIFCARLNWYLGLWFCWLC